MKKPQRIWKWTTWVKIFKSIWVLLLRHYMKKKYSLLRVFYILGDLHFQLPSFRCCNILLSCFIMLKTARSPLSLYEATHFSFSSQTPGFKHKSSLYHLSCSHHIYLLNITSPCVNKTFFKRWLGHLRTFKYRHVHLRNIALFLNEYMSATMPMFLKCLLLLFSFTTEKLIWRLRCNEFICWKLIYSFFSPSGNCLLHFSSFVQTYSNNFYLPYNVTSKSYSLVLKFRRSVRRRVVSFHFHPISLPITISLIKLTKIARRSFWKLSFESINHASGFR